MLLGGKQTEVKRVAVVTRNQKFNRLFGSILADWKFLVVDDISTAKVVFAERGLKLPPYHGQVVWLTPLPLMEGPFLTVPIGLTSLYHLLETHLFPTPRRNIRVTMEALVDLRFENDWLEGHLISLSGRGGRFTCTNEIPRGKSLTLEFKLANKLFTMPSEVLYCIPAGDSPGRLLPQIGALFKPVNDDDFKLLQCFVERVCIESACSREGLLLTDPCVSWLDLPVAL